MGTLVEHFHSLQSRVLLMTSIPDPHSLPIGTALQVLDRRCVIDRRAEAGSSKATSRDQLAWNLNGGQGQRHTGRSGSGHGEHGTQVLRR